MERNRDTPGGREAEPNLYSTSGSMSRLLGSGGHEGLLILSSMHFFPFSRQ